MSEEQDEINQVPEAPKVAQPKVTELPPVNADEERAKLGKLNWDTPEARDQVMTNSEIVSDGSVVSLGRRTKKNNPQY